MRILRNRIGSFSHFMMKLYALDPCSLILLMVGFSLFSSCDELFQRPLPILIAQLGNVLSLASASATDYPKLDS